jgi:hypothetical protein
VEIKEDLVATEKAKPRRPHTPTFSSYMNEYNKHTFLKDRINGKQPFKVQTTVEEAAKVLCEHGLKASRGNKLISIREHVHKLTKQYCEWKSVTEIRTKNVNDNGQ